MAQITGSAQLTRERGEVSVEGGRLTKVTSRLPVRLRVRVAISTVSLLLACNRERPIGGNDSVGLPSPPSTPRPAPVTPSATWDSRAGPMFAVPGASVGSGYLVIPTVSGESALDTAVFDLTAPVGKKLQLLKAGRNVGSVGIAELRMDRVDDCTAWPTVNFVHSTAPLPEWNVGIAPGLTSLSFDSSAGTTRADSLTLAVSLARLASGLPGDTAIEFRGRPYVVRTTTRFADDTHRYVVAEIVRSVSQEATPLQEHLLVIAEMDSTAQLTPGYFERTIGNEDALETSEVLAVIKVSDGIIILLGRDLGDGVQYSLIERDAARRWRLKWSSPYAGC